MKLCFAGAGAIGIKHLEALSAIEGVEVASLVDPGPAARDVAARFGIPHVTDRLAEGLARPGVVAAILATPTPLHAAQAAECLDAGKHVLVEIPMADTLHGAEALLALQRRTGLVAMAAHTRRFNPSHQWVHRRIAAGELTLQHLTAQTQFLRRTNTNALGQPRDWTDHLLWHHACHTVDLFAYQAGAPVVAVNALQGPPHPVLGIAMDMSLQLRAANGALCSLSLSFNNDGPIGTVFRYICDRGTYLARYDDLFDGRDNRIDVSHVAPSTNGIELQDREFVAAIREGREPNASFAQVLPTMAVLARAEAQLSRP